MSRYYVHDLESDKLEIHTGGKADWLAMPEADRDEVKRACLWSNRRGCWVSRAKAGRTYFLVATLKRLGFEDRGRVGEKLTFAEQVAAKQERAGERAGRAEERAAGAKVEADTRFNSPNVETLRALQGEPVKLGHHSAKRHLRLIEKADNDMRKGCEAMDKAKHYAHRADAARATAEGAQYSDPAFLGRRVAEGEAEERDLLRRLDGAGRIDPAEPLSDGHKARLEELLAECRDKLGFYRHCLATCGRQTFDKATLAGKTMVKVRGRWELIVKLNPKTVAVPNICFPTEELQRKWALKYPYSEVQDAK